MEQGQNLLDTATALFWQIAHILTSIAGPAETWLRASMRRLGVPPELQTALLVAGAVGLGLTVLRAMGGLLRVVLVLALVALAVQALGSHNRPTPPARRLQATASAAGTPLLVEYSKCSTASGCTIGWMACAAIAASLNPCRISLSLPG